jgi:hypothetical protein
VARSEERYAKNEQLMAHLKGMDCLVQPLIAFLTLSSATNVAWMT